jgi:signal transduction histidine kinase
VALEGGDGPGTLLAWLCGGARWIALIYVGLTYPSDLPGGRDVRNLLRASAALFGPGNVVLVLVSRPEWNGFDAEAWWPHLSDTRWVYTVASGLYGLGCVAIVAWGSVVVFRRLRTATGVDQLVLKPSLYGMTASGVIAATAKAVQSVALTQTAWRYYVLATGLGMLVLPGTLIWSSLKFWIARAGVIETITRLSRPATPEAVRQALATALHDDSIEVFLWSEQKQGLLSSPRLDPDVPPWAGRAVIPVLSPDRSRLAYITTDPRLEVYPQMLEAAVSAARMPLENARINADLREALDETRQSRKRIFEAQMAERRRLERDLHDGVQQRILAVALRVEQLRIQTAEPATERLARRIKADLRSALEEIRNLARGLHPAALQQGGLSAALAVVASSLDFRVTLDIDLPPLTPLQESAVYFIVSEALTNAAKHADAGGGQIQARLDHDVITVQVTDDGRGGAVMADSGGLRGISDRVGA